MCASSSIAVPHQRYRCHVVTVLLIPMKELVKTRPMIPGVIRHP
jgi:hypothetical protein